MEDPLGQAVSEVIKPLLTGTSSEAHHIVIAYFTPNCSLQHPLYQLAKAENSRERAAKIFATRSDAFTSKNFNTQSVALDESNNKVFCDVRRTISLRYVPFGRAQIRSLIVLELVAGGDGRFYIAHWEELLQADDLSALMFLPGARLVLNGLRSLAALATSIPSSLFGLGQQPSSIDDQSNGSNQTKDTERLK